MNVVVDPSPLITSPSFLLVLSSAVIYTWKTSVVAGAVSNVNDAVDPSALKAFILDPP